MDVDTNGSRVYKPWLVFRRFLWVSMMAYSIIFLSVKLLLHFITELRSKLIVWLKPLTCWKSALFSCPDLIEYLCCLVLASNDIGVWPTYDSGQFAHGILYMQASDLVGLLFIKIFLIVLYYYYNGKQW